MRSHLPPAMLALASIAALLPAPVASNPVEAPALGDLPLGHAYGVGPADLLGLPPAVSPLAEALPRAPGTVTRLPLTYGPFVIPPGHDLNRVVADVPLHRGFLTAFHYRLADAVTGEFPTNMEVHIHHALWFRVPAEDVGQPGLPVFNFDRLLFGTGEERTDIDLDARSDAAPGGPRYGLWMPSDEAQNLVLMLHNKETRTRVVYVLLEVAFVHGSREAIAAAAGCANLLPLPGDAGCAAGKDFHPLEGRLWGDIFHVPVQDDADGIYVHPPNMGTYVRYTAPKDGTLVATWGHVHPLGRETVLVNLGSTAQPCGDLDGDGFPGITLLRSRKWDRNPQAWPFSEEFQMGGTQHGYRAPVRAGDRIAQLGVYSNAEFASYYQMTFAATHVDPLQPPAPRAGGCTLANTGPTLLGGGDPTQSQLNRPWEGPALPLCGGALGPACDFPAEPPTQGVEAPAVVIAGFAYLPGQAGTPAPLGAPVVVPQGTALRFVNADFGALVRHSVTSCPWPCNGPYRANYPLPDGVFDSGNLGNVDLFNGEDLGTEPVWDAPSDLAPGLYAYYCRLHPSMRGAFEVAA